MKKWKKSGSLLFLSKCFSNKRTEHIDVVIPTTDKDLKKLSMVIPSLSNIQHYIDTIYLVAPKSEYIIDFCNKYNCVFVDENTVLGISIKDINYKPCGVDRSGWIFQQLLKLNCDNFCNNEYILVADSDTVFTRKQFFIRNKKMVFDCSDEYHKPYFSAYKKLLGLNKRFALSFVAHHMLFKKSCLAEMKRAIEEHTNQTWIMAILNNLEQHQTSSFSEYETYGNYMYAHYKNMMLLREWYNKSIPFKEYQNLQDKCKYKTVSMHSYNE